MGSMHPILQQRRHMETGLGSGPLRRRGGFCNILIWEDNHNEGIFCSTALDEGSDRHHRARRMAGVLCGRLGRDDDCTCRVHGVGLHHRTHVRHRRQEAVLGGRLQGHQQEGVYHDPGRCSAHNRHICGRQWQRASRRDHLFLSVERGALVAGERSTHWAAHPRQAQGHSVSIT